MTISEFHIKQTKKELTCTDTPNKIVLNKYDNKVSKIIFDFDDCITGGRLYFVMLNPITKQYSFTPIINSEIMMGTNVTVYPGIWKSILIAVQDDYEIIDNDIDQSKVTFVSNEFARIVVRNNFLDEEHIESTSNPAIDKLLDDFYNAWETLENAAISAAESEKNSKESLASIKKYAEDINNAYKQIEEIQELIVEYARNVKSDSEHVDDVVNEINNLLSEIDDNSKQIERMLNEIRQIKSDILVTQQEIEESNNSAKEYVENAVNEANDYAVLSKRYAIGDNNMPESIEDNAKYYAHQAKVLVSSIVPMIDDAKEHIDEYVKGKEETLKGETGNVYFASFGVVNGRLKMYSDTSVDKVKFSREGSRLKYRLEM